MCGHVPQNPLVVVVIMLFSLIIFLDFLHLSHLKQILLIENQLSCKIKQRQIDGGGEYMSQQFQLFLDSNGIFNRIICPHTT